MELATVDQTVCGRLYILHLDNAAVVRSVYCLLKRRLKSDPNTKKRDTVLRYVSRSLPRWEHLMPAETNLRADQLLTNLNGNNGVIYDLGLKKWQKIKIERDHLALLPESLKNKKYFRSLTSITFPHAFGAFTMTHFLESCIERSRARDSSD